MTSIITIPAALVQELRARTGAGLMACKQALQSVNGDINAAADAMRKAGQVQAERKAGRVTAEGRILIKSIATLAVMLEINCETDFVARDDNFIHFAETVAQLAFENRIGSLEVLLKTPSPITGLSVEDTRQQLITKLGENVQIRRLVLIEAQPGAILGAYVHMERIGAVVELQGGSEQLATDLVLHVVANHPLVVTSEELSSDLLAKEQEIFTAQAQASGKPQVVIDKMVEGRLNKFIAEVCLLDQVFLKDETMTVKEVLLNAQANLVSFVRFSLGEGIEKSTENFADAVMLAQNNVP